MRSEGGGQRTLLLLLILVGTTDRISWFALEIIDPGVVVVVVGTGGSGR